MTSSVNFSNGGEQFNIHLDTNGNLHFKANNLNGNGTTRMLINDDSGNVGIGTTSPNEQLVVMNQAVFGGDITSPGSEPITVTGGGAGVSFQDRGGTTDRFVIYNNAGALRFWENGDRVVITQNTGNVGIGGPQNPTASLQVRGELGLESDSGTELWNLNVNTDGNLTFNANAATGGTTRMVINDDTGNVGIGTTSPSERLHVVGNICATGNIGRCSDFRYKMNVESIKNALSKVLALRGTSYQWNQESFPEKAFNPGSQIGFIGQEVEAVFPEVVSTDSDGYKYLDYSGLTPVLVEAIKEQQQLIETQKSALGEALDKLGEALAKIAQLETTMQTLNA